MVFRVVLCEGKKARLCINCQEGSTARRADSFHPRQFQRELTAEGHLSAAGGIWVAHHSIHYSHPFNHFALSSSDVILLITSKHSWAFCPCVDLLYLRNRRVLTPTAVADSIRSSHNFLFLGTKKDYLSHVFKLKLSPCQQKCEWI